MDQIIEAAHEQDSQPDDWDLWDPLAEDFASPANTLALDTSNPIAAITGRNPAETTKIGGVLICDHYSKYGTCADGDYCDRVHIEASQRYKILALQETYERNKNRTCLTFSYLSPQTIKPDPESLLLVSVTDATCANNFYLIAPYESLDFANKSQEDVQFYISRVHDTSAVKVKLERIHEQLSNLFDHNYRIDNVNERIYLSQIVACKLNDGHFRRAMVIGSPDFSYDEYNYKLLLLDVGTQVELPREKIYDIKATLLSEPPLALNCRLDLKPATGQQWSAEALEYFNNFTRDTRFLYCQILDYIEKDSIFTVDLMKLDSRESIMTSMIEQGFAEKCIV